MTTGKLAGKRALVTGGTRGIGRRIAEKLRDQGAAVTVTGTRPDGVPPEGCDYRAADFSERDAILAFADSIVDAGFDIVINNAGINRVAPFAQLPVEDFELVQRVNVLAPWALCRAAVPGMVARGWGRIVNISSIWGKISREHRAAYSASKFALDGMTAALAAEVARAGVLANCVAPGFIDTELTRRVLGDKNIGEIAGKVPAGRLGSVDEVAEFVVWLAGPDNTFVSGQNLAIDGGFTRV